MCRASGGCGRRRSKSGSIITAPRARVPGTGMVVGLPYSIAAWVPGRGGSFAPPVHLHRLEPGETAVEAAVAQVRWLGFYLPTGLDWRAGLDGAYGNRKFFTPLQDKDVPVVARTRADRVLYRRADPAKYHGVGECHERTKRFYDGSGRSASRSWCPGFDLRAGRASAAATEADAGLVGVDGGDGQALARSGQECRWSAWLLPCMCPY